GVSDQVRASVKLPTRTGDRQAQDERSKRNVRAQHAAPLLLSICPTCRFRRSRAFDPKSHRGSVPNTATDTTARIAREGAIAWALNGDRDKGIDSGEAKTRHARTSAPTPNPNIRVALPSHTAIS